MDQCAVKPLMQVLQLPLEGPLERGGLAFVLKRPPGRGAEWLKSAIGCDFFLDFSAVRRQHSLLPTLPAEFYDDDEGPLTTQTGKVSHFESTLTRWRSLMW